MMVMDMIRVRSPICVEVKELIQGGRLRKKKKIYIYI